MTTFSKRAWEESSGVYQRILDLPFNRELADGTLSHEVRADEAPFRAGSKAIARKKTNRI